MLFIMFIVFCIGLVFGSFLTLGLYEVIKTDNIRKDRDKD